MNPPYLSFAAAPKPFICAATKTSSRSGRRKNRIADFLAPSPVRRFLPPIFHVQRPRNSLDRRRGGNECLLSIYMRHFDIFFTSAAATADNEILSGLPGAAAVSLCGEGEGGEGGKSIHVYRQNVSLLIHASTNKDCGSKTLYCSSFSSPYVIQIRMYSLNINTGR